MDRFILNRSEVLLLIVDIQERLAAVMAEKRKVVSNAILVIDAAKLLDIPMLLTEQYPRGLGLTIPEIKDALQIYNPIEKITFSCCGAPPFLDALKAASKTKVILFGMETHVCVLQTCLDLLKHGYIVHVLADAVCSRTAENYHVSIELMRDAGAVITCTETVLFQLLKKAGTEEFKTISRKIK